MPWTGLRLRRLPGVGNRVRITSLPARAPSARGHCSLDSVTVRLQLEGASIPKGFDSKRFFEKLATEGASSTKPLGADEFFEKLRAEGASVPVQFDGAKFVNTIRSEGLTQPDLVVPNK